MSMRIACTLRLLRFSAIDRLLRFQARKFGLSEPPTHLAKKVIERNMSPAPARSILMTLAPMSAEQLRRERPLQQVAEIEDGDAFEGLVHWVLN